MAAISLLLRKQLFQSYYDGRMAKKPKTPFGKMIAEARQARGHEQANFARLFRTSANSNMSQSTLSLIEVGRVCPAHEVALNLIDALARSEEEKQEMLSALSYLETHFKEKVKAPNFRDALAAIMARLGLQYAPLMRGMFDQSMAQHIKEGIRLPSPEKLKELVKRLQKADATPEELLDLEKSYIYDSIVDHSRFSLIPLSTRKEMARAAADAFVK